MKRSYRPTELELHVLLAVLQLNDRAYGVSIQELLEDRTDLGPSLAAIYLALERLSDKRLVESELGEATQERGGRAKRFYRINPSGRQVVSDSINSFSRMVEGLPSALGAAK